MYDLGDKIKKKIKNRKEKTKKSIKNNKKKEYKR